MQNGTPTALPSQDEAWGFFGTIGSHAEPEQAWMRAMRAATNATGHSDEAARAFLDSRYGRHSPNDVASAINGRLALPNALESPAGRWRDYKIDGRMEEELGIPRGLPYLTGLVCMHEALLEVQSA
jgi:hypothetical protein